MRSLALRCRGLVDGEVEPLIEAAELARQAPLLVEHAGACEDAASLLAARRRTSSDAAGRGTGPLRAAGADAWAGRVRAGLRSIGAIPARGRRRRPREGWESLTATERAVSLLVAEGLTNGAVARRMYVSPHTVNTHLRACSPSSAYRTGSRSPPWCITRSSDVVPAGLLHIRWHAVTQAATRRQGGPPWTTLRRCGRPTS